MEKAPIWIGLDLGENQTQLCALDQQGNAVFEGSCSSEPAVVIATINALVDWRVDKIAVEAGFGLHLVRCLRNNGFNVAIFEARKASKFLAIRRNKTDAGDSRGLADLARIGKTAVSEVFLKILSFQQIRSQIAIRHQLVKLKIASESAVRAQLKVYGCQYQSRYASGSVVSQVENQLAALREREGLDLLPDVLPLARICEAIRDSVKQINKGFEQFATGNPVCEKLMEVPGVGPICAVSFYSAVEDPMRFKTADGVAAYLGLTPRRFQSGDVSRTRHITKTGNKITRTHLVSAATILRNRAPDCALKRWEEQLSVRVGKQRSRVALARKISIVLLTIWRTDGHFIPFPTSPSNPHGE